MKRSFKAALSVCAAFMAFFTAAASADIRTTDQLTAREGNILVEVPGTFYNKDIDNILYKLNLIRYTACREGDPETKDTNTGTTGKKLKLSADWGATPSKDQLESSNGDYVPLEWSAELERIAEIRSAEALILLDHRRPNSNNEGACTMLVNGYGFRALENLAWNYDTSLEEAIDQFLEERADWVAGNTSAVTGHYTNIICMNRTYVGMSSFRYAEDAAGERSVYGWGATALETAAAPKAGSYYPTDYDYSGYLYNKDTYIMTTVPTALTGKHTQLMEIATKHATGFKIDGKNSIQKDETTELTPIVSFNTSGVTSSSTSWKVFSGVTWSSSDPSIAKVDQKGVVTGIKNGDVTITAKVDSLKTTFKLSVRMLTGLEAPEDITVASGSSIENITLPKTVKGIWSDGGSSDETVSWDTAELTQKALNTREGTTISLKGQASGFETTQKIVVSPATVTAVEALKGISTKSGTAPALPATAKVSWSNGDVTDSVIKWNSLTKEDYMSRTGKTISLKGTVEGQDISIGITVTKPSLSKLSWVSEPTKKTYQEGDKLNVSGGKISAAYDDGSTYETALTASMVEGFSSKAGKQTLTVKYEGGSLTYDIKIEAKAAATPTAKAGQKATATPTAKSGRKTTEAPAATATPAVAEESKTGELLASGNSYKLSGSSAVFTKAGGQASVSIPASIKVKGKIYKVTSISDNAFKDDQKIENVTIGDNVTVIGKNAFSNCKKLRSVVIGKNVRSIKANAFRGCKSLKTITVKSKKLKASKVGKNAFKGIHKKALFKLPKKKFKTYRPIFRKAAKSNKIRFKKI